MGLLSAIVSFGAGYTLGAKTGAARSGVCRAKWRDGAAGHGPPACSRAMFRSAT